MRTAARVALAAAILGLVGCSPAAARRASNASSAAPALTTTTSPVAPTTTTAAAGADAGPTADSWTTAGTDPQTAPAPATWSGGPLPVIDGTRVLDLVDTTRPTVSRGTYLASSRSLPTYVWMPDGGGPYPLVVFAHGFRAGVVPYARFARLLADAGYVVAAPSFPLTDEARAGSYTDEDDIDHEAADISFVLSAVLADPTISPHVDRNRVVVAGHSDGASVAVQVGYDPPVADHRVSAVVAFTAGQLDKTGLEGPPLLLEQSDTDEYNDLSTGEELYDEIVSTKWLLVLHGASHIGPVEGDGTYTPILDQTTLAFLSRYVTGAGTDDAIRAPADQNPDLATISSG